MKPIFLASAATATLTLAAGSAAAGNLDRTQTPIDIIFEKGNYGEISLAYTQPSLSGRDNLGNPIGNVAKDFGLVGGGFKLQFTDRFAIAVIYDQPYGVDVAYGGNPAATLLGGTQAEATSDALTLLARYNVTDRVSVYGGPRVVNAKGDITLSGLGYGALNGYNVKFASDQGLGYVLGAAYEIPDIAFRAALTYHSEVDLEMSATETFPAGVPVMTGATASTLPQSVKLQVQSGVAKDTLVFGSVRWSEHSAFTLDPPSPAPNLATMNDSWTYEIGVGRRFTEKFSANMTYIYEDEKGNNLVSPLAPTHGRQSLSVGGKYQVNEMLNVSGGIRYTWLGDALAAPGGIPRGTFTNNDAISVGVKLGVNF